MTVFQRVRAEVRVDIRVQTKRSLVVLDINVRKRVKRRRIKSTKNLRNNILVIVIFAKGKCLHNLNIFNNRLINNCLYIS